jgi:hypothetical protein
MNMGNVNDLSQSKFFSKRDCPEPVWLTITGSGMESVKQQNGQEKQEVALYFHENPKPFILKSTNGQLIATFTGQNDYELWQGVRVQMWVDPTIDFGGKIVGGVRVKAAMNPRGRTAPQQAPPPSTYQPPPEFDPTPPREPGQDDEFDQAMNAPDDFAL